MLFDMKPESIQWLLDHTSSIYENELKETDKLKERISFIFTIAITPAFGLAFYLAIGLKGELFSPFSVWLFWLPWAVSVTLTLVTVFLTCHVLLSGWKYRRVPLPSELIPYFEAHPEPDKALEEAKFELLKVYSLAVDINFEQNQKRSHALLQSQRVGFFALILLWGYCAENAKPEPQSVKIVAPIEIKKDDMPNLPTPKPVPPVAPQKQDTAVTPVTNIQPQRPAFPQGRIITESDGSKSAPKNNENKGK